MQHAAGSWFNPNSGQRAAALSKWAPRTGRLHLAAAEPSLNVPAGRAGSDRVQGAAARPARPLAVVGPRDAGDVRKSPTVFVLSGDTCFGDMIAGALAGQRRIVEVSGSGDALLACRSLAEACLVLDARPSSTFGLRLLHRLGPASQPPPVIAIIKQGDVRMAVHALQAGALDCIELPLRAGFLADGVERALARSRELARLAAKRRAIAETFASLTQRERQIMELVLAGHPNKNIAADLGVSQRTIESHRAAIMRKSGAKSLPALVLLALAAAGNDSLALQATGGGCAAGVSADAVPGSRQLSPYYPNLPPRRPPDTIDPMSGGRRALIADSR
jgi:FixJ family two-component response regulator